MPIVRGGCPVRDAPDRVLGSLSGVVRSEGPPEQSFCLGAKSQNHATRSMQLVQHGNN